MANVRAVIGYSRVESDGESPRSDNELANYTVIFSGDHGEVRDNMVVS